MEPQHRKQQALSDEITRDVSRGSIRRRLSSEAANRLHAVVTQSHTPSQLADRRSAAPLSDMARQCRRPGAALLSQIPSDKPYVGRLPTPLPATYPNRAHNLGRPGVTSSRRRITRRRRSQCGRLASAPTAYRDRRHCHGATPADPRGPRGHHPRRGRAVYRGRPLAEFAVSGVPDLSRGGTGWCDRTEAAGAAANISASISTNASKLQCISCIQPATAEGDIGRAD